MGDHLKTKMADLLLQAANHAAARGEVPVAAAVVSRNDGQILSIASNAVEALRDPTQHAEIRAIRHACAVMNEKRLPDCDLWVTLEPCTMCIAAISFARIKNLYIAAKDPKGGGVWHGAKFFDQPTCHHRTKAHEWDEAAGQSSQMLKDFFKVRRGK